MTRRFLAAAVIVLVVAHSSARAVTVLDLTQSGSQFQETSSSNSTFIVSYTDLQPTGTGVIDPFLTIQMKDQEQGYNTDATPPPLDTKRSGGGFTRAVQLGDIGAVQLNGTDYLKFLVDANQTSNGPISLNQVQFFVGKDPGGTNYTLQNASSTQNALINFGSAATQVFQMSDSAVSSAKSYDVQIASGHGSGSGDLFLYVPAALFGSDPTTNVTMFTQFGTPPGTNASNAGFEEWAYISGQVKPVPEPTTLIMAVSGLVPLAWGGIRSRRRRMDVKPG